MRFAVIGAGTIGALHAQTITQLPDTQLVCISDIVDEAARSLAERHTVEATTDLEEVLMRSDIDAVAICTPSGNHADLAVAALKAGKHVIVEKPLDVSMDAARRVAAAEVDSGRCITVVSQHRFDTASQIVHEAVRGGQLGKVTSGSAMIPWWRSQAYYDSAGWRGTWAMDGGGALMNQGIHTIDLLIWFLGEPVEVFAWTGLLAHDHLEVEDTAVATIRFASGALGIIHGTTAAYPGLNARIQVHGSCGSAIIDNDTLAYFHAASEGEVGPDIGSGSPDNQAASMMPTPPPEHAPRQPTVAGLVLTSHTGQYQDFVNAVHTGRPPLVTVKEATRALAVVCAIYESAVTGAPVDIVVPN